MGIEIDQKGVKLVMSIIFKDENLLHEVEKELVGLYGDLEEAEKTCAFDYTDYYHEEMGKPLMRKVISFKKLVEKEDISRIKLKTNELESHFSAGGGRAVNIDPGYVTEAKLVLLTTKDYTHRVYIGKRIFAESTLFYQDGSFRPWPWTYPDYASRELASYFEKIREIYIKDIKAADLSARKDQL